MKHLLLAFALLIANASTSLYFVTPVHAENKALPDKIKLSGKNETTPVKALPLGGLFSSLLKKIQDITLADLKAANALALSHGNTLGSQCYTAWIGYIEEEQQASNGPDGKPIVLPPVHLIFDAEKIYDLLQALAPTSKIAVACAPFKNSATSVTIPLPLP